jgi:hypothetical protein
MAGLGGVAAVAQAPAAAPAAAAVPAAQGQAAAAAEQPVVLSYGVPGKHVIVTEDTLIRVMTDQPLSSKKSKEGMPVSFTVSEDVVVNHVLVIPRGAIVHGEVVSTKKAGVMKGGAELTLKLDSLDLGGESYPLYTYHFTVEGESKTKPTSNDVGQAAEFGALAGAVVSAKQKGGPTRASNVEDISAGAAIGAGAEALSPVLEPRPVRDMPAESEMDFYLALPISVQPVSEKDAERLGKRVHPGGPVLYVRGGKP